MDESIVNGHTTLQTQPTLSPHQQTHPRHYGHAYYQRPHHQRVPLNHSYDPNMCTTAARFSESFYQNNSSTVSASSEAKEMRPPQQASLDANHHHEEELLGFNNVILLHETAHEIGAEAIVSNSETLQEATPKAVLAIHPTLPRQLHEHEPTFAASYHYMQYEQTSLTHTQDTNSTNVGDLMLHRSPNGQPYHQNYLVNTQHGAIVKECNVQFMENQEQEIDDHRGMFASPVATPARQTEETQLPAFELSTQYEQFQNGTNEVNDNSVELIAQFAAEHYESDVDENRQLVLANKDEQRLLLESTMSPLLAAVNDITKRDAELQLYLKQHLEKESTHYMAEETNNPYNEANQSESLRIKDSSDEDDDYLLVADQVVECRAKATLPINYLYFGVIDNKSNEPPVLAKKTIPRRTMFGPYEGQILYVSDIDLDVLHVQTPRCYPVLMIDDSHVLDISNEDNSNWMRYIRLAQTYAQQNLQLLLDDGKLYLRCVRDIRVKEELRVGYHSAYSGRFLLPMLIPTADDLKTDFYRKHPWKCFECKQRFQTSAEMKTHLNEHDVDDSKALVENKNELEKKVLVEKVEDANCEEMEGLKEGEGKIRTNAKTVKAKILDLRTFRTKQRLLKIFNYSKRCCFCEQVFMANDLLKQHIAKQHPLKRNSKKRNSKCMYKCNLCAKRFHKESLLMRHKTTSHEKNLRKPHQCNICDQQCATPAALAAHLHAHEAVEYSCVFCEKQFKYVRDFKKHVETHKFGRNGFYECMHCKKQYADYHLVRKHVRIFHTAKEHACNSCDKKFTNVNALQRHRIIHTPNKKYVCITCGKKFGRKDHLTLHTQRKHSLTSKKEQKTADKTAEEIFPKILPNEQVNKEPAVVRQNHLLSSDESFEKPLSNLPNDGTQYFKMSPMKPSPTTATTTPTSSSNRRKQTPTKLKALELNAETVTYVALSEMLSPFIISESALNEKFKIPTSISSRSNKNSLVLQKDELKETKISEQQIELKTAEKHVPTTFSPAPGRVFSPLYPFSCHICPHVSFRRRGMLINHVAKIHPTVNLDEIELLGAPLAKKQLSFPCPYCSNVYKLNAKRKAHIIKHHPGQELPPIRPQTCSQVAKLSHVSHMPSADQLAQPTEVAAAVGTAAVIVHKCDHCHKQYASHSKLANHYRKVHLEDAPPAVNCSKNIAFEQQYQQEQRAFEPEITIMPYQLQPPVSPENKLLKLSSAATLELSRFDDDFFNERVRCSNDEVIAVSSHVSDLHQLPALFEESSIAGIDTNSMEKYNRSIEAQFFEKITKFS